MRYRFQVASLVLAMVTGAIATGSEAAAQQTSPRERSVHRETQDTAYATQTSNGRVTLEVRPQWSAVGLTVALSANTHSVELGALDLRQLVRLIVNDRTFSPDSAGTLGGHHGSTTLLFRLEQRPGTFTLEIRGVPDVEVRTLRWPAASGAAR